MNMTCVVPSIEPDAPPAAPEDTFVIRKDGVFYRPNFRGYTHHIEAAGIYTRAQAEAECANSEDLTFTALSCFRDQIEATHALLDEKRRALGLIPRITDRDLRAIAARHEQDAPWFSGGLHDPSGYVCVAHKDRGVLLETLRAIAASAGPTIPYVTTGELRRMVSP